jgi:Bacterial membrane protein YfhO
VWDGLLTRWARRDAPLLLLLAALPAMAYAPAWTARRLLGPGDGAALHFPLRALAWEGLRHGELPEWNPTIFLGTPLLASYRPGLLYPPMAALALLPPFAAFQVLVLGSLAASAVLTFLYLRRLGAERMGAFVGGMCFALGPYLFGHLADTATLVAAPLLLLVLLAAEDHMRRGTAGRAVGLSASLALVLLSGSPEAARAGAALVAGRLVVGHVLMPAPRGPSVRASVLALLGAGLLAAPQLLPTLVLARDAGRSVTGLANRDRPLAGLFGLALRYASHTPAASLALAALPLALTQAPIRVLGLALTLCLALQWGRGPLSAPGAPGLVFDLTLCILAGLSLSAQWRARRTPEGARLRAYFLVAALASAAVLSVAAAAVGPLPESLSGAVGVLALSLILYFSLATSPHAVRAGLWLLPLTVSFLLQPGGRRPWDLYPAQADIEEGSATRRALWSTMGAGVHERTLALVRDWPRDQERDLAYANWAGLAEGRSANGYDPMVPLRTRLALGGMGVGGTLPNAFFRSEPARLETLGVRWVELPASALAAPRIGFTGEAVDLPLPAGQKRFFPLRITPATEIQVVSLLSDAVGVAQGTEVARVEARLATGRAFELSLRAGVDTAEWSWERPDVRPRVAHERATVFGSWIDPGAAFSAHRYLGRLRLPGRYLVDGVSLESRPGTGRLQIARLGVFDALTGALTPVSLPASFVSDTGLLAERAATPLVWLFEVVGGARAWVAEGARVLADDEAVLRAMATPGALGVDPRREAFVAAGDAGGLALPPGARASRAEVIRAASDRLDIRAEGPGLLVVAEGWDLGWSAAVDGAVAAVVRVNHAEMAVPLGPGIHRVVLSYRAPGLVVGLVLFALSALAMAVAVAREARARRS